jgi:Flp pilus assembly protein TadD
MGRRAEARDEYQEILQIDPINAQAMRGLAQLEDWDGRHLVAQALLRRRLQQEPSDMDARRMLAQSLVWSGRPDVAIGQLELALNTRSELRLARAPSAPRDGRVAATEPSREFPK